MLPMLRLKPYTRVSFQLGRTSDELNYRVNFPSLKNQEFDATFKFRLRDPYSFEDKSWPRELTKERLKRFYKRLLHLDAVFTEFKTHAEISDFPEAILAIDAECYNDSLGLTQGEYCPAGYWGHKKWGPYDGPVRTLPDGSWEPIHPQNIESVRQGGSMCTVYCSTNLLELDRRFIHELLHHVRYSHGLESYWNGCPHPSELRMLKTTKTYLNKSWIPKRFEDAMKQER